MDDSSENEDAANELRDIEKQLSDDEELSGTIGLVPNGTESERAFQEIDHSIKDRRRVRVAEIACDCLGHVIELYHDKFVKETKLDLKKLGFFVNKTDVTRNGQHITFLWTLKTRQSLIIQNFL